MKTHKSHQLIAIFMTFLVTMSSFSMTIRSHYCGDNLVEMSLFSEAEEVCASSDMCSMEQDIERFDCCYDIVDIVESHKFVKTSSFEDLETIQKNILFSYVYSGMFLIDALYKQTIPNPFYKSPPLIFDIHSLDEVYLI